MRDRVQHHGWRTAPAQRGFPKSFIMCPVLPPLFNTDLKHKKHMKPLSYYIYTTALIQAQNHFSLVKFSSSMNDVIPPLLSGMLLTETRSCSPSMTPGKRKAPILHARAPSQLHSAPFFLGPPF